MNGDEYVIKRFLPKLEEPPQNVQEEAERQMPKLTPAPKTARILKRRSSEYYPKKEKIRVPVSLDDSFDPSLRRPRRSNDQIHNDRLQKFIEKQVEELERIQSKNSEQDLNAMFDSAIKLVEDETENEKQELLATSSSKQELDGKNQQTFKVPQPLSANPTNHNWPRRKIVVQDFYCVSNIAYATTKLSIIFKCCSSMCNYKSNSVERFKDHLMSYHNQDKYLRTHNQCNICKTTIEALTLAEELSHMINFHIQREESVENLISYLEESEISTKNKDEVIMKMNKRNNLSDESSSVFNTPPYTKEDENRIYDDVELNLKRIFEENTNKISHDSERIVDQTSEIKEQSNQNKNIFVQEKIISQKGENNRKKSENEMINQTVCSEELLETAEENKSKENNLMNAGSDLSSVKILQTSFDSSENNGKTFKRSLSTRRTNEETTKVIEKEAKTLSNKNTHDFVQMLIEQEKSSLALKQTSTCTLKRSHSYQQERSEKTFVINEPLKKRVAVDSNASLIKRSDLKTQSSSNASPTNNNQVRHETTDTKKAKIVSSADLMPWIPAKFLRKNEKYEICFKKMLRKCSLVANFKCMGLFCSFATSNANLFLSHLGLHEKEIVPCEFILLCSYCVYKGKNVKDLTHHIYNIHTKDIFQCPKCFFRSREKQTCFHHMQQHHGNEEMKILQCPRRDLDEQNLKQEQLMMERLKKKRCEFVQPIRCKRKFELT